MNTGKTIRKILFVTMWLVIGSGMVILLAAAMRKQKNDLCKDYSIKIKGGMPRFFIDENDVQQMLATANGKMKGQPISSFNLNGMELLLEKNSWIKDAELYFDNRDVLHIVITEREPIARIFTTGGNSFYIDGSSKKMALCDKMSARVPVFTGFPDKKVLSNSDSLLLTDVNTMAQFIINDSFWMAQAAQIDITPERNFEMIPVVGNNVIRLGNGENIDQKFHRLFVFYKEILSKTGFDKYPVIDVQYDGQVVASKQAGNVKVDSAQLRKNVDKLLKEALDAQMDTTASASLNIAENIHNNPITEKPIIEADSATGHKTDLKVIDGKQRNKPYSPNAVKTGSVSKPVTVKKDTKKEDDMKTPKAVMPKKE